MEGNMREQIIEEDEIDLSEYEDEKKSGFYHAPAFIRFVNEAGENKAKEFFDLMNDEKYSRLFVLHAGYRNGGQFVYHAGATEAYYFIKHLKQNSMVDKIMEAGKTINGKSDFAIDAGDLVHLFGPIGAAELVNEFGVERIKNCLTKIVFMKKNGSTIEEIYKILKS